MDELEIKIVLDFKVPENDLTLNGIFYGLDKDNPNLMNHLIKAILEAFEEKAIEELKSSHPGRYARNGRQSRGRKFITSFGPVRYKLAQVYDKKRGKIFFLCWESFRLFPIDSTRERHWRRLWDRRFISLTVLPARRQLGTKDLRRLKARSIIMCKSWPARTASGHLTRSDRLSF